MAHGNTIGMLATAAAIAVLAAGPVSAQKAPESAGATAGEQQQSRPPKLFRILDTNADGRVTLDEITAEQKRLLSAADLDGDGKLSVPEFRRRGWWFQQMHTTTLFDLMDANGDRTLTAEEIAAPSARWFKRYDTNADGGMSTEELPQWQRRKSYRGKSRGR